MKRVTLSMLREEMKLSAQGSRGCIVMTLCILIPILVLCFAPLPFVTDQNPLLALFPLAFFAPERNKRKKEPPKAPFFVYGRKFGCNF